MTHTPAHLSALAVLVCCGACTSVARSEEHVIEALVREVGNAATEQERLVCLERLEEHPALTEEMAADLGKMVEVIRDWAHGPIKDFSAASIIRREKHDFGIAPESPLYPLTFLYGGRSLTWALLQERRLGRKKHWDRAQRLFEKARKAFPDNRIVGMYLGDAIASSEPRTAVPGAPEWAAHQRDALERLTGIIHWWIGHRQRDDGQYGGGWEDDCEMWRWWAPVLLGFEDPKINGAQARFSRALMCQPHMSLGYTKRFYDVEHTAEGTADSLTPMMHIDPDNPEWQRHARRLAELFETLWTGVNARGQLQFRSTYFNDEKVSVKPERACDTTYHTRVVQPALLLWQRTGDRELTTLFARWLDTWVDAAGRAERGKPAGIVPSAIHWPDGIVGGVGPNWWDPGNHVPGTYQFPTALSAMAETLLLAWHMTGEARYLEPIRTMAAVRLGYLDAPVSNPDPGTKAWCAQRMGRLVGVLGKYRLLTGNGDFDALLKRDAKLYLDYRLHGNAGRLTQALAQTADALSVNFEGYTSEVRYTDRVLRFPRAFAHGRLFSGAAHLGRSPDTNLLYSTVTGDPGAPLYFPLNAVRWLTPPRDIAALVKHATSARFEAELFHFGESERAVGAELLLLTPGEYTLTVQFTASTPVSRTFSATESGARVAFTLPPRRSCILAVRPSGPDSRL